MRKFAILFFVLQGAAATGWWAIILRFPRVRGLFLPFGVPDAVLLSLLGGDLFLYIGGSFLSAYGLARQRPWTWPIICVHAGAAAYAALYALLLSILLPCCRLGAILMMPSLAIPLYLSCRLRPKN
jgi:hypothetical protein